MRTRFLLSILLLGLSLAPAAMAQSTCTDGQVRDDGSFENSLGFNAATVRGSMVMRFEAPTGSRLKSVCVCWKRFTNAASVNFSINIWRADGPGGLAGTLLATVPGLVGSAPVGDAGQFTRYEMPPGISVDGPVYIGPAWSPDDGPAFFVCLDESVNTPKQAMYSVASTVEADEPPRNEVGRSNSSVPFARAFGIRPVFETAQATAPQAPTGLTATAASGSQVNLSWQDNSNNEDSFQVEQLVGGTFQVVGSTASNVNTATIGNLLPGTSYSFRVRASNPAGTSAYSNTATVTTPSGPAPSPPPGPWLTTNQLPGFQFKVRINGSTSGTQVADCVPETLCVAGAIPTRSELFLRIIGPRANGFLWSQVIRFSPSRLEVWAQRTSGGPIRYYDLPAVPLESSILDGLVDKEAFQP